MSDNLFPVAAGSNAVSIAQEVAELAKVPSKNTEGLQHLKFVKGDWKYGKEEIIFEDDEVLLVNPLSFVAGWQGWEDRKPISGPIVPLKDAGSLPPESTLQPIKPGNRNGWSPLLGVTFLLVEDDGARTTLQYHTTSYGGRDFVAKLKDEIVAGVSKHAAAPLCLVKLTFGSYIHSENDKVYTPEFEIVGWADEKGEEVKKLTPG